MSHQSVSSNPTIGAVGIGNPSIATRIMTQEQEDARGLQGDCSPFNHNHTATQYAEPSIPAIGPVPHDHHILSLQPKEQTPAKPSYVFEPVFSYGGVDVPFDSTDLETMEKYEAATAQMTKEGATIPKDGPASGIVKAYCLTYEHFFDAIFGDGTFLKMCGNKYSMFLADDVLRAFLACMDQQRMARQAMAVGLAAKYLPNRAARRAADKK